MRFQNYYFSWNFFPKKINFSTTKHNLKFLLGKKIISKIANMMVGKTDGWWFLVKRGWGMRGSHRVTEMKSSCWWQRNKKSKIYRPRIACQNEFVIITCHFNDNLFTKNYIVSYFIKSLTNRKSCRKSDLLLPVKMLVLNNYDHFNRKLCKNK